MWITYHFQSNVKQKYKLTHTFILVNQYFYHNNTTKTQVLLYYKVSAFYHTLVADTTVIYLYLKDL